MYFYVF